MSRVNIAASIAFALDDVADGITFTPTDNSGNIFVSYFPPKPDVCVSVMVTGEEYEMGWGMEDERETTALIKVRTTNTQQGFELVHAIADRLHTDRDGTTWTTLNEGTVKVISVQVTNAILYEYDTNNLPVHIVGVTVRWVQPAPVPPETPPDAPETP